MIFLIVLIFLSKISFGFIPGFPYQESFFIFQKGLHPFINIFLNALIGSVLILQFIKNKKHLYLQNQAFKFFIFLTSLYLLMTTTVQILTLPSPNSGWLQFFAALSAIFTIYLFGRIIPSSLSAKQFVRITYQMSLSLCYVSLLLLVFASDLSFKGGRFIGVFKHIPYMVTTATLACILMIYPLIVESPTKIKRLFLIFSLFVAFSLLILTGTRSALFAVMLSYFLAFLFFPATKPTTQFIKVSLGFTMILAGLFFGDAVTDYALKIVRGESAVGLRAAQDGVASRFDEFQRGYEAFSQNPMIGQGLLSKFGEINENDVGQYNAFKDPHNILVSAGLIGGWGFVLIVLCGFAGLIIYSFKKLKEASPEFKIMAIYILTHAPILFIYHMHLSLGGMADRFYWIFIGYMMIHISKPRAQQGV